jgi:hypothetical protein
MGAALDTVIDKVAMELVSDSKLSVSTVIAPPVGEVVCDPIVAAQGVTTVAGSLQTAEVAFKKNAKEQTVTTSVVEVKHVTGNIVVSGKPVEVEQHRQVKKRNRATYSSLVVAECKLVFGTPRYSDASVLAVRRHAVRVMKAHGVRPAHIGSMVPKIIELVFVPSEFELEAKRLASSWSARHRVRQFFGLSASRMVEEDSTWDRLCQFLLTCVGREVGPRRGD